MNKNELVKAMAEKSVGDGPGIFPFSVIEKLLNVLIEVVSDELKQKGKVTLVGFGTFSVAHRKEKTGVNPRTGERVKIEAKDVPVFKPGKELKELVK